jgi:Pyridoxamine 5'-phosphate oxidase
MVNRLPPTGGQPTADHPDIPDAYGVSATTELVEWGHVEERLRTDRIYWVATVGTDGSPRVRPVSGLYLDGVIHLSGSTDARWVRDVLANPRVSVHLDGPDDVVIVEGDAEAPAAIPADLAVRLAAVSNAKFPDFELSPADFGGPGRVAIRPRKVIAWTDFGRNPTRFRFE